MTLKEFVIDTLNANNMTEDYNSVIEYINEEAQERAGDGGCVAISDEEVRQMIINYPQLAAEKKAKAEEAAKQKAEAEALRAKAEAEQKAERELEEKAKEEKAKAKKIEKQNAGEQINLFGWQNA